MNFKEFNLILRRGIQVLPLAWEIKRCNICFYRYVSSKTFTHPHTGRCQINFCSDQITLMVVLISVSMMMCWQEVGMISHVYFNNSFVRTLRSVQFSSLLNSSSQTLNLWFGSGVLNLWSRYCYATHSVDQFDKVKTTDRKSYQGKSVYSSTTAAAAAAEWVET